MIVARPLRAALIAVVAVLASGPAAAVAAAPTFHAHRGGTVVNGKPVFAEEGIRAYKQAARHGFVLEAAASRDRSS